MDIADELQALIGRLNNGVRKDLVCEEARIFLASVDPAELHEAEKQLMERGVLIEQFHQLCAIHLNLDEEEDNLPSMAFCAIGSSITDVMYHEHEIILDLLEELESIGHRLQSLEIYDPHSHELTRLPAVIDALMNVESHLRREEQVIFPELESVNSRCSPKVLAAEHQRLRDELASISELVHSATTDIERFRQKAVANINIIVPVWWRHIFKENNIILPSFAEYVTDEDRLAMLKSLCDRIGYAGFENMVAARKVV